VERPDDDVQLMDRLAVGDDTALAALYDACAGPVFALLLRIVADRAVAEDLLQETFLRAWQRAATYRGERGRALPWLLTIAHNLAINELRRRGSRPRPIPEGAWAGEGRDVALGPDPGPDPAEVAWLRQRRAQLRRAVDALPTAQRVVIDLYALGHSQTEIAAQQAQPLGTVKSRLRLALRTLRVALHGQGLEDGTTSVQPTPATPARAAVRQDTQAAEGAMDARDARDGRERAT